MTIASPDGASSPFDDVDGRDDAVDRGGQGGELDLGLRGRRASCAALETWVSAL